ncbi:cadmium resistance transporter [Scleromatobacter humisilvae]|uniref:Cadmium resistance transporter n=1 Tax=Scleromatobacter humisilvae TaxID=2897159 RepID=A0A9X2C3F4_9BURK|nr:cadmium resistance transporter [Scleromatobacter humisilvae]MCK9687395.1 cadmium resistance transporter [Scleromatobacter humisilvae]
MTALVALAVGLFVTTNLDDLFMLVAFFSDARVRPRQIVAGQLAGLAALYAASVVFSLLSLVVAPAWIGLLGVLPIAIGLHAFARRQRGDDSDDDDAAPDADRAGGRANVLVVAATTIANGGDNLGIYTPVFATRSGVEIAAIGVVFAAMTMAWVGAAFWLTRHPTIGPPIQRHGRRVAPFVLVALGAWILHDAGSFALLASWLRAA